MKPLLFATGSLNKLAEVQAILPMPVEQLAVNLPELQSMDLQEIVTDKLKKAYIKCHLPVVVEDVSAELAALNGFPGPFVKFAEATNGPAALHTLLVGQANKQVTIRALVGYHDGTDMHFFPGSYNGSIVAPRGRGGFGFDSVVVPNGYQQTMAEMPSELKNKLSHRYLAFTALAKFLQTQ